MKKIICFAISILLCITVIVVPAIALTPVPSKDFFDTKSLMEYEAWLKKAEFDYDFVTHDQISYLGDFKYFRHIHDDYYELDLPDGERLVIEVYQSSSNWQWDGEYDPILSDDELDDRYDLRFQPARHNYVHNENLIYHYAILKVWDPDFYPGRLSYIIVKVDDTVFRLYTAYADLSNPGDQPLAKFFNIETADEAYKEFAFHIRGFHLKEEPEPDDSEEKPNDTEQKPSDNTPPVDVNQTPTTDCDNKADAPADSDKSFFDKLKSFDFGCKSVVSGGAVTLLLCTGAAVVLIPKKKKR